jgi:hypothetical protein
MARHPEGIVFYLEQGRENEARLVDDRMSVPGDSYYWYQVDENLARLKYFVIHHSVTPDWYGPNEIANIHLARGWNGIGYHFVITKDGVIHYVGDLGTWRANVANMNDKVIGVNLIGDFRDGRRPTDAQYRAANVLFREFVADGRFSGIKSKAAIKFHNELQATACPCDVNKAWIGDGLPAVVTPPITVTYTPDPPTPPTVEPHTPDPVVGPGDPVYPPVDVTSDQVGNKPVVLSEGPKVSLWMKFLALIDEVLRFFTNLKGVKK